MPTLHRLRSSRVVLYVGDHLLPHVHVKLSDGRGCAVDIATLEIRGRIAAREIREELAWVASNRVFLRSEWRRYNP